MNACDSNSERLSALADGELGRIAAWRLRRHVAGCAGCSRELADFQTMTGTLREADVAPGSEERYVFARQRAGRPWIVSAFAATSVVATAIVAGVFYASPMRSPGGGAASARAAVDEAMSGVRTAQWDGTTQMYDFRSGQPAGHTEIHFTAQLDPPVLFWNLKYFRPGSDVPMRTMLVRSDSHEQASYLVDGAVRRMIVFRNPRRDIDPASAGAQTVPQRTRKTIQEAMFYSMAAEQRKLARPAGSYKGKPVERRVIAPTVRTVTVDGKPLIEIRDGYEFLSLARLGSYSTYRADPSTHRLVSTETNTIDTTTKKAQMTSRTFNYTYNMPLPPGTFDLHVPAGTPLRVDRKEVGVTRSAPPPPHPPVKTGGN